MNIPADLKYAKSHEWARLADDGLVTVGISDHAQEALGDIVFLELPQVGRKVKAGEECAVVESVKAAYAAWLFKLKPDNAADLDGLLDAAAYAKVAAEG
jgi:glycine cleavage system H protein